MCLLNVVQIALDMLCIKWEAKLLCWGLYFTLSRPDQPHPGQDISGPFFVTVPDPQLQGPLKTGAISRIGENHHG